MDEDIGVLELGAHLLGVGDEVGRQIAAIELHALDDVEFGLEALRLLDRDHALVADLLHRVRDHLADRHVAVGRDRADLRDFRGILDLPGALGDILDRLGDGEVDAALEVHRVHAGGDRLGAFAKNRSGKHRRGSGAALALPPPRWLMRILSSIVLPSPALVPAFDPKLPDRSAV